MDHIVREVAYMVRDFIEDNEHLFKSWRRGPGLGGMCGVASMILSGQLKQRGIQNKVVWGDFEDPFNGHVWVETKTHIVDITATQFDKRNRVYIIKKGHPQYIYTIGGSGRKAEQGIFKKWDISEQDKRLIRQFMKAKEL